MKFLYGHKKLDDIVIGVDSTKFNLLKSIDLTSNFYIDSGTLGSADLKNFKDHKQIDLQSLSVDMGLSLTKLRYVKKKHVLLELTVERLFEGFYKRLSQNTNSLEKFKQTELLEFLGYGSILENIYITFLYVGNPAVVTQETSNVGSIYREVPGVRFYIIAECELLISDKPFSEDIIYSETKLFNLDTTTSPENKDLMELPEDLKNEIASEIFRTSENRRNFCNEISSELKYDLILGKVVKIPSIFQQIEITPEKETKFEILKTELSLGDLFLSSIGLAGTSYIVSKGVDALKAITLKPQLTDKC